MKDTHPEAFTVHLGGKTRTVKMKVSAFTIAQIKHGVSASADLFTDFSLEKLPRFVWIGLLPDEPDLPEMDVITWLAQSDDEAEIIAQTIEAVSRMGDVVSELVGRSGKVPGATDSE